ncbi:MAG: hypothetical protein EOO61_04255 [Hymenobacter sp.]|nr:MAG: hypothetical protein EOO61_04255 [Hymenobacter sp.]
MMTHLHPKTAQLLALPNPARIEKILLDKWIPYTRAQSVLDKLANLYAHPTIDRMPNMLLTGEAGNGKTTLLKRYSRQFQPYIQPDTGKMQWHVLYINAPDEPDERRLYYKLFDLIGEVVSKGERLAHQQSKLLRILKAIP